MTLFNNISNNDNNPNQGKLLISEPFLNDPYFGRAVVLLTEHNESGSLGFILNKPIELNLADVIDDFPEFNGKVYLGGPVKRNNLFFIHTLGKKIDDSVEIIPGLFWGGNFDMVKSLISCKVIQDNEIRFFAGYSGWAPQQLTQEIKDQSWFVGNPQVDLIMKDEPGNQLWSHLLKDMGKEYAIIANFPVDPSLN